MRCTTFAVLIVCAISTVASAQPTTAAYVDVRDPGDGYLVARCASDSGIVGGYFMRSGQARPYLRVWSFIAQSWITRELLPYSPLIYAPASVESISRDGSQCAGYSTFDGRSWATWWPDNGTPVVRIAENATATRFDPTGTIIGGELHGHPQIAEPQGVFIYDTITGELRTWFIDAEWELVEVVSVTSSQIVATITTGPGTSIARIWHY